MGPHKRRYIRRTFEEGVGVGREVIYTMSVLKGTCSLGTDFCILCPNIYNSLHVRLGLRYIGEYGSK